MSAELLRKTPTSETWIDVDGDALKWATKTYIPDNLLATLAEGRKANRRAPLGDAEGSWHKVAELPLSLVFDKIPPDQLDDPKAWRKLVNDSDYRYFRCDGDNRTF